MSSSNSTQKPKVRPLIAAKERGPGPGRYALPSTFGSVNADKTRRGAPSFSFGARTASPKKLETPGPTYINPKVSRHGTSAHSGYTLSGRPRSLKKGESPAPGAYAPEKAMTASTKATPAYTMGAKTAGLKKLDTPAPGTYQIPPALGRTFNAKQRSAPAVTMGGRLKTGGFADDTKKTPAPGSYASDPINKKRSPAYSMSSRNFGPQDRSKKPGPGAHSPEKVQMHKKKSPAFSMGVRHSEYTTQLIVDVPE
eukprot:m.164780 g.164780  ORF g.164780 m.164780 type:complete len:253 (+) comp14409_c0_seq9:1613-2371(+)